MQKIIMEKVNHLDTHKLIMLAEESVNEGFRHIKRLINDYEAGTNKFDKIGEALFIAYLNNDIVGVCGLNRDPYTNQQEVGRVRRLYVSLKVRRFGIGRMLMDSIVEEARKHYKTLVLKTDNPIADIFYRSIGFSNNDSETYTHYLQFEG